MRIQATSCKLQANSGYTLFEAIIYLAILAVLSVTFISLLFTMVKAYTEFRLSRDIASSASLGLERLIREIRRAENINLSSALGTNPGRLFLGTTDVNGAPTTVDFYLSGATLMVKEGTAAAASTTSARVAVDNLVFRQTNTIKSCAIKIELTLTSAQGLVARTEKFYATAVMRGSYPECRYVS